MGFKPKTIDTGTRKERVSQKPVLRNAPKKGPTIVSIGMELIVAVGMNLLRRHVKTWGADINAKRKELTAPEKVSSGEAIRPRDPIVEAISEEVKRENSHPPRGTRKEVVWFLLKTTATQWINDKCPQLGAALAYFTVFSLAPLVLILLAFFGLFFGSDHARDKIIEQLRYMIDPSGIQVIKDIASSAAKPQSGILATLLGIVVGLFGASGVFGQLQDALNTIWGVKAKPGAGLWAFLRARFLSFAMVAGVCFLLLVSLTVESVLRGLSTYLQNLLPGGHILALLLFLILDVGAVIALFAMIFRFLPDIKIGWRDVWIGASLTGLLFVLGKFILGLYLGSGAAGSAYGAASSLITLLLWIYYSAQILLFGAEFTQVYTHSYGSRIEPEDHAVRVKRFEVEVPATPVQKAQVG
ncbi:MAG TPA: YihY/virulence factor BrkB family protein [Chthoniobacterales bacterium]|jgi:membrane protein|nr:YihY/virulence factor BrkB family protein [Chthoniobacterales bacterium]